MRGPANRQHGTSTTSVEILTEWGGSQHHVLLTFSDFATASTDAAICGDPGDARATGAYTPPADVTDRFDVRVGEPFGPRFNGFDRGYQRLRLVPRTQVAARTSDSMGFLVLRVDDDDVRNVLRRYGDQRGTTTIRYRRADGARVPYVANSPRDAGYGSLYADTTGRWLLVETGSA